MNKPLFSFMDKEELVLRPYQEEMVLEARKAISKHNKIVLQAPCGAGKTVFSAHVLREAAKKGLRCAFVADRIALVDQTSKVLNKFGINHGVIQAQHEKFDLLEPVQVCSIQTLKNRGHEKFDFVIVDECFVGDTIISTKEGDKKIKDVNVGDIVYNAYGCGEVTSTMRKISTNIIKVRLSNGKEITCTKGHPFFTDKGWRKAGELDGGERVFSKEDLLAMRSRVPSKSENTTRRLGKSSGAREMLGQDQILFDILQNEVKQPDEKRKVSKESDSIEGKKRENIRLSFWRKWFSFNTANEAIGCTRKRLGFGICCKHWVKRMARLNDATPLQNRYSEQPGKDSNRGGRVITQLEEKENPRSKEREISEILRVESVEDIKPTGGIDVYNLEVSRHPSYFAGGVLVHNCHAFHEAHKKLVGESKFAIGLSATPWRKGLGKYFNDLICPVTTRQLIDEGFLVDFKVYGPKTINTDGLKVVAGDYSENELAERCDTKTITGDIISHYKKHAMGLKTICFCVNIAHARHVSREFNRNGVEAVEINSYHKTDGEDSERQQIMDSFCTGSAQVICSVDILGKGFDYPGIDCVILARPTKSPTVHVQQVGRGLRIYDGAPDCLIIDHAGNHERLGFVDDMPVIGLNDSEKKKSQKKEEETEEKLPQPCPSCDYLKPAEVKECPACGLVAEHIKNINVEDGELAEVKRKNKDRKDYTLADKQEFLGGLNCYARDKGMSKHRKGFYGWALYRYQDKFGCRPSNQFAWDYICPTTKEVQGFITHGFIKNAKEKEKIAKTTCECGCSDFEKLPVDNIHKIKQSCNRCGKFFKWGH